MKLFDYECKTTFWMDFTIAKKCGGIPAIKDTYKRAMADWSGNYIYLTELVMVLNHKIWQWYDGDTNGTGYHTQLARCYNNLWQEAAQYAETHLKGDELSYYYEVTD